jgi:hypothetical protein
LVQASPYNNYRYGVIDVGALSCACEIEFISDSGTNRFPCEVDARIDTLNDLVVANYDRNDGKWHLWRKDAGVWTELGNYTQALAANDRLRLEVIADGSTDDINMKVNDVTLVGVVDQVGISRPATNYVGTALYYQHPVFDNLKWWLYQ